MSFSKFDFESMREWLKTISNDPREKSSYLICFDLLRYREDYEAIYNYITVMGGEIEDV